MPRKSPSPAEDANKATKPSGKPTPKRAVAESPEQSARKANLAAMEAMGTDELCIRLRAGETLTAISRSLGLKSIATLLTWIAAEPERSVRAREARSQASAMYDEQAQAAIEEARDPFELAKARELAQHFRWRASKIDPAYGDKVQATHTGPDGGPIQARVAIEFVRPAPRPEGDDQ